MTSTIRKRVSRPARRVLVSSDEAKPCTIQHTKPCGDCPWRRDAVQGWLGGGTPDSWVRDAHGDGLIMCHTKIGPQCAGAAIYRTNVAKMPRDPEALHLPADRVKVFKNPMEFKEHHTL